MEIEKKGRKRSRWREKERVKREMWRERTDNIRHFAEIEIQIETKKKHYL